MSRNHLEMIPVQRLGHSVHSPIPLQCLDHFVHSPIPLQCLDRSVRSLIPLQCLYKHGLLMHVQSLTSTLRTAQHPFTFCLHACPSPTRIRPHDEKVTCHLAKCNIVLRISTMSHVLVITTHAQAKDTSLVSTRHAHLPSLPLSCANESPLS